MFPSITYCLAANRINHFYSLLRFYVWPCTSLLTSDYHKCFSALKKLRMKFSTFFSTKPFSTNGQQNDVEFRSDEIRSMRCANVSTYKQKNFSATS